MIEEGGKEEFLLKKKNKLVNETNEGG